MPGEWVMGIDGGGSTVRVVITTRALDVIASSRIAASVNPNYAGRDPAQGTIREAMRAALDEGRVSADQIGAVAIGVAGAFNAAWQPWLRETVAAVLPGALTLTSGDQETALAGARGEPFGVMIIAGTGSVIFGRNPAGQRKLAGGWGFSLGDEGGGNWLGREGVRAVMAFDDGIGPDTALTAALLGHLQVESPRALIGWVYQEGPGRADRVAALAPVVMSCATDGDSVAQDIVERGAAALAQSASAVMRLLHLDRHTVAFAGSLLENPTPLRAALCAQLDVDPPPVRYPPVVGAALLAAVALDQARQHS